MTAPLPISRSMGEPQGVQLPSQAATAALTRPCPRSSAPRSHFTFRSFDEHAHVHPSVLWHASPLSSRKRQWTHSGASHARILPLQEAEAGDGRIGRGGPHRRPNPSMPSSRSSIEPMAEQNQHGNRVATGMLARHSGHSCSPSRLRVRHSTARLGSSMDG